jgi:hypothetical protein
MISRMILVAFALYLSFLGVCDAQTPLPATPAPLTFEQRFQIYVKGTYGLSSVLVPAVVGGIQQATDSPKEWGQGWTAYGERVASVRGQFQFHNLCEFGVDAALHEDPRFLPSGRHGTWARTKYVFVHTLVARTDSGGEQPAFGAFAGALGYGFFPDIWLPPSQNSIGRSFTRSAIFMGVSMGKNMGVEFGPDDRKFLRDKVIRPIFHR